MNNNDVPNNNGAGLNKNIKTTGLFLICAICVVGFNISAWGFWHSSFILNDGVQYLSTAGNWLDGRGFSTDALMYKPHFQGTLPAPQTVWPPGYPFIIALTSMLGISLQSASLLLNLISLAVSAFLVLIILVRQNLSLNAAICCALIFYCTAIPWSYSLSLIAEPLFSMLILTAIYSQPGNVRGRIWPWIVSGIIIALCIFIRYSGVFFAVGVGIGMVAYFVKNYRTEAEHFWRGIALLTLQISISVVFFATMLYRTYLLTGTIKRDIGVVETEEDWIARLKIAIWQISEFIGFTDGGGLTSNSSSKLFGLLLLLCVIVLAQIVYVSIKASNHLSPVKTLRHEVMCYVIIGHSAVFAVFFGLNIAGFSLVELNHRYLYQIYPGLFILLCILVANTSRHMKNLNLATCNKGFRLSLCTLFCLFAIAQLNNATALKHFASPGLRIQEVIKLRVTTNTDLQEMIQSCFELPDSQVGSIWSNAGQQLHRVTDVPTITIADVYGNKPYDVEIVRSHIASYNIRMFVFLDNLPDIAPEYTQMLFNVRHWLEHNGYTKMSMLENKISGNVTVDTYVIDPLCADIQ